MSNFTEELMDELDAFDPKWRLNYSCIGAAAIAANVLELHREWLLTDDGKRYLALVNNVPDHVGRARREADVMRKPASLPYGYDNLGDLPDIDE